MPVDPAIQNLLDQLAAIDSPPVAEQTVEEARAGVAAVGALAAPVEVDAVLDRMIPGPDGDVPIRVYSPEGAGPHGVLVWFHGGGWVAGDLDGSDGPCRGLCALGGFVVVSVGYRLAPEHPFPAGLRDCEAAVGWVAEHAGELGVDPARLAIGGDSAGGNLATVVARSTAVPVRFQLLVYPVTDARRVSGSYRSNGSGYLLTAERMAWFVEHYLSDGGAETDPRVSPLLAPDLAGLPPALVITAEFDPLRDEGEAYAERLREAGVETTTSRYDGMIHPFFQLTAVTPVAQAAVEEAATAVAKALA